MFPLKSGYVIKNRIRYKVIQNIQNTLMKHLTVVCKHKDAHLADVRLENS